MGEKLIEMAKGNGICIWNSNMPELEQRTQTLVQHLSKPSGTMTANNL